MIGVGLIGCGYWGANLARCVAEGSRTKLTAVHDRDRAAAQGAIRRWPGVREAVDLAELLGDASIDAVVIATPVETHHDIALAALNAGKHVLLEKPITRTSAEARTLIAAAERRGRVLMVDHTFVYTPAIGRIRELIAGGELGRVNYYDSLRISLGLFRPDVNVVWDLAIHDLAILDHLLPDGPVAVSAQAARHVADNRENMAFLTLTYADDTVAHINVNWLAPVKIRQILVGGSKKMVVYDDLLLSEKLKVYDSGVVINPSAEDLSERRVGYRAGDMWAPRLPTTEALRSLIDHFAHCIETGATPITDGRCGLRIVEQLEFATSSIRHGGRPIEFAAARLAS